MAILYKYTHMLGGDVLKNMRASQAALEKYLEVLGRFVNRLLWFL